jgi:DNA-binding CsgD family transcriptional regulator
MAFAALGRACQKTAVLEFRRGSGAMALTDYESLLTSIDLLYAAALHPDRWQDFLTSLADQFEAKNAFICEVEYRQRSLAYVGLPQPDRARIPVQRYETLIADDPRTHAFRSSGEQPMHCRMATTTDRLHNSRVYCEYLKPLGIEYTMVVVLPLHDGVTRDVGLTRGPDSRPFDEDNRALMSRLVPHVERAFTINGALETKLSTARRQAQSHVRSADQRLLEQRFELSPAQAQLAALLYDGASVKQAAVKLGITEGSARQYLKKVFEKTGVKRQLDLIRAIEGSLARDG